MKINDVIIMLNKMKNDHGNIDIHMLIHDNKNGKNFLSEIIHLIYYDEKTNSVELFGFISKDDI